MKYLCDTCYNKRPDVINCPECLGMGLVHHVAYATEPWSEIVPNLWVGGHVYVDEERDLKVLVETPMLDEAGFGAVFSLYTDVWGIPSPGVHHEIFNVPDDMLFPEEIREINELAQDVATYVEQGTKTLVRCYMGMNRSALVAGIALVHMGHDPRAVVDLIRSKRAPSNLVNPQFVEIIESYVPIANTEGASA